METTTEKVQVMLDSNTYLRVQVEDLIDTVQDIVDQSNKIHERIDADIYYIYSHLGSLKYQVDEMKEEYDTKIKYLTLGIILLSALTGVTLLLAALY
jgi:hypothetical protein